MIDDYVHDDDDDNDVDGDEGHDDSVKKSEDKIRKQLISLILHKRTYVQKVFF